MGRSSFSPRLMGCRLEKSVDQSIATGTTTDVTWAESGSFYDPFNLFTSGTDITVPTKGIYMISFSIGWDSVLGGSFVQQFTTSFPVGAGNQRFQEIWKSGHTSNFRTTVNCSGIVEIDPAVIPTFKVSAVHNRGSARNILSYSTFISFQLLRKV